MQSWKHGSVVTMKNIVTANCAFLDASGDFCGSHPLVTVMEDRQGGFQPQYAILSVAEG